MKKKLFSILLSLAMVVTMMPMAMMTAFAGTVHELTVEKVNGGAAVLDTDYSWDSDKLIIKADGLVVSGTTSTEFIEVDESVTDLTIKDLVINNSIGEFGLIQFLNTTSTCTLTVLGTNTLNPNGIKEAINFFSAGVITGTGDLSLCSNSYGIFSNDSLTLDCSGTITVNGETCAFAVTETLTVTANTGKICAYGDCLCGAIISDTMTVDPSLVMTGSATYEAEESAITGEAAFDPDELCVKTGGSVAKSVLIRNNKVATPTASVEEGTYTSAQRVELSTTTEGATIYYTTDGTTPSSGSTEYTGAITVDSTKTIKAIAVKEGWNDSEVFEAKYTITSTPAPTPDNTDKGVKTGDSSDIIFYGFATLLALLGAGFVYGLRRKEEK